MTPDQYKEAEKLQKAINNHKGILAALTDAANQKYAGAELKAFGKTYTISERLVHEFMHATQHSLNKLQEEFNQL